MSYQLSLFDKSPIPDGGTAADALATSVVLAQKAEQLGYHRVLLGEHHGALSLAGSAPEILATWLLAATRTIRIGTGGILLQHYSPYKVAEVFGVLATLAPGRVDLGIGKAPGGMPHGTRALQAELSETRQGFERKLRDLDAFLNNDLPADHPLAGAVAVPHPVVQPGRVLLGASPETAQLAGSLGWDFIYAGHHNGDPAAIGRSLDAYRAAGGRAPGLAVSALVCRTTAEARKRVAGQRTYKVSIPGGQTVNLSSREAVAEYARQAGATGYAVEERTPSILAGSADHVGAELALLSRRHGIGEFILDIPLSDGAERLAAIELLGPAHLRVAA